MSENKKIAINSLTLYIKLIITILIGLYTTRTVLLALGADNYGLYAVVGGIVVMMNLLSTAMLATTYRFITVELGKEDENNLNKIFNTSRLIHLILALLFIIIAETIGVWYINNYLNVAPEKIPDALFVLHLSVLATVVSIASIPYQGLIIAQENFLLTSAIQIISALIGLGFILLLTLYIGNKLKAYASIMAIVTVLPSVMYYFYCFNKNYKIVRWKLNKNKSEYLVMLTFTCWIIIGTIAYLGLGQGTAVMINLFFGTTLNAAFAIATQISNQTMMFVTNLTQAAVPQIMKSHSSGDTERSLALLYSISKYAFFVTLIPIVPLLLSIDSILKIWLKTVPEFTKQFVILMLIGGLISVIASGFNAAIQATGKIRKNQILFSLIMLSILPIAYFLFKFNYPPYIISILSIGATIFYQFVQVRILARLTDFKVLHYLSRTIKPAVLVTLCSIPQLFIRRFFGQTFLDIILFSIVSVILIVITIFMVGLNKQEKCHIINYLRKIKINNKSLI